MNEQAIGLLIVWAIGVGALVVLLIIFRGFLLWLIGASDIIRLLEEQNRLLEIISAERTRNVSRPNIVRNPPQP